MSSVYSGAEGRCGKKEASVKISVITPTHNPQHLFETAHSMLGQTHTDWEWIILANGSATTEMIETALEGMLGSRYAAGDDRRITVIKHGVGVNYAPSIGAIKRKAFDRGTGDVLVELDHDDLLTTDALAEIDNAFNDDSIDFAYSNFADFKEDAASKLLSFERYPGWEKNGWRYRDKTDVEIGRAGGPRRQLVDSCVAFPHSAASLSLIYYAPNHVRAWRRTFYEKIDGHDPAVPIADDHELLIRTYLHGKMKHIDKCLYLYRMGPNNTFAPRVDEIKNRTYVLHAMNIEALVLREAELRGLRCYDLGGAFGCPPGWIPVDRDMTIGRAQHHYGCEPGPWVNADDSDVITDLKQPWPFANSSVMAFRCHDIIEHLPDKQHTMAELHRCLVPGGWALINVPSTDGRGAFQDPTHVSYWNQNSFWYWTRPEIAKYIHNTDKLFMARRLFTHFPNEHCKAQDIPYTTTELCACKGNMTDIPGVRP